MEDERLKGKFHLALIGEGPIRTEIEKKFAHLSDRVSFHDFMSPEQLGYAYPKKEKKGLK